MRTSRAVCVLVSVAAVSLAGCSLFYQPGTGINLSKPFQASYLVEGKGLAAVNPAMAKFKQHVCSDGSGHLRLDTCWDGKYEAGETKLPTFSDAAAMLGGKMPSTVEVLDVASRQATCWIKGWGVFTHEEARDGIPKVHIGPDGKPQIEGPDQLLHMAHFAPANSKTAKALGAKNVNDRNCHGWKDGDDEVWIDDECGIVVSDVSPTATTTMTEFSAQGPDSSVFQPPEGYVLASDLKPLQHSHQ